MSDEGVSIRIEWLDAPGVTTPELAATWARYQIWIGSTCITEVETSDGTLRRSVYGSLYPLAEWITNNWWLLTEDVRPSALPARHWTWPNVADHEWLRSHNLRGAGNGMTWPNLTLVPEGPITHARWAQDDEPLLSGLRFVSAGNKFIVRDAAALGLTRFVENVLERLTEQALPKTRASENWAALSGLTAEERDFCQAAARLGLDPFALDDAMSDTVIGVAEMMDRNLIQNFFTAADTRHLPEAARWTREATEAAVHASASAPESLDRLRSGARFGIRSASDRGRPWRNGYEMARGVRRLLNLQDTDLFDLNPWFASAPVDGSSYGIKAIAAVKDQRCGIVVESGSTRSSTTRFSQARALGRALATPSADAFLLSNIRSLEERSARAFAAELLAPAAGIRQMIGSEGERDEESLETAAARFDVSPFVIQHQVENQLASSGQP